MLSGWCWAAGSWNGHNGMELNAQTQMNKIPHLVQISSAPDTQADIICSSTVGTVHYTCRKIPLGETYCSGKILPGKHHTKDRRNTTLRTGEPRRGVQAVQRQCKELSIRFLQQLNHRWCFIKFEIHQPLLVLCSVIKQSFKENTYQN